MNDNKSLKEVILYLVFGVLTTVVSIGVYALCDVSLGMNPLIANVISWIFAVTFAYLTNQRWVFESNASGAGEMLREAAKFYAGRLFTLGMEEVILLIGVTWLAFPGVAVKLVAQVLVLVGNYVISKFFVFK